MKACLYSMALLLALAVWKYRGYGYHFPSTRDRIAQLEEGLEVMRRLFSESRSTFQGKYYALDDAPNNPKPVQTPGPPSRSAAPESSSS